VDPTLVGAIAAAGTAVAAVLRTVRYKMKIGAVERALGRGDRAALIMTYALEKSAKYPDPEAPTSQTDDLVQDVPRTGELSAGPHGPTRVLPPVVESPDIASPRDPSTGNVA
jgi:hypothetical protein